MSSFIFTEKGFEHYLYWQSQDKRTLKKINQLLKSIERDGAMHGIGKPEPLKHKDGEYSRRIDEGTPTSDKRLNVCRNFLRKQFPKLRH